MLFSSNTMASTTSTNSSSASEIHYLNNGWLELESDPGVFTLLLEDFGCKGVQVEEIYDLSNLNSIEDPVGYIYLFKWREERRSRHRQLSCSVTNTLSSGTGVGIGGSSGSGGSTGNVSPERPEEPSQPFYVEDEELVNSIFFAHQIIPNSCATHSLLSVLLNCKDVELGEHLKKLQESTRSMNPENKGLAIGNIPELAKAHNFHASRSDFLENSDKSNNNVARGNGFSGRTSTSDSFHFVSFVPINNRVYELDGLKKFPIDHGPIGPNEKFSEKFRQIIMQRIPQQHRSDLVNPVNADDIRYSLMAVIPDRRVANVNKLKLLKQNRQFLLETVETICRPIRLPDPFDFHNYCKYPPDLEYNLKIDALNSHCSIKEALNEVQSSSSSSSKKIIFTKNESTIESGSDFNDPPSPRSTGSSTDTSSEVGSEFNCPIGCYQDDDDDEEDDEQQKVNTMFTFKFSSKPIEFVREVLSEADKQEDCRMQSNADRKLNQKEILQQIDQNLENGLNKSLLLQFYKNYAPKDLVHLLTRVQNEIEQTQKTLTEEQEKRDKFRIDDARRTHDYDDFIVTFLLMLTERKKLNELLDKEAVVRSSTGKNESSKELADKFFEEIASDYEIELGKKRRGSDLSSPSSSSYEELKVRKTNASSSSSQVICNQAWTNANKTEPKTEIMRSPVKPSVSRNAASRSPVKVQTETKNIKEDLHQPPQSVKSLPKIEIKLQVQDLKKIDTVKRLDYVKKETSPEKKSATLVLATTSTTTVDTDLVNLEAHDQVTTEGLRDGTDEGADDFGLRRTTRKRIPKYPDSNYETSSRSKRTNLG